jgi:hypothetical protein
MKRLRFKPDKALGERLNKEARLAREKAAQLPPGKEREDLLQRAHGADIAARIDGWLSSSGLRPPK